MLINCCRRSRYDNGTINSRFIVIKFYNINNFNYFCNMKKINLRGISEILSERELKSVVGGVENHMSIDFENPDYALDGGSVSAGSGTGDCYNIEPCDNVGDCRGKVCGESCTQSSTGRLGKCYLWPCGNNILGFPSRYGTTCAVNLR
jgi:hypothetical protein